MHLISVIIISLAIHGSPSTQVDRYSSVAKINIAWAQVMDGYDALLWRPEPSGYEVGRVGGYLCRAFQNGTYVPGKLWVDNGRVFCTVSKFGKEHQHDSFQVPNATKGTTSWEPTTSGLPENAVVGGNHWDGAPGYVCRAKIGNNLVPGIFYDVPHSQGACFSPYRGREVKTTKDIEVLVLNAYGILQQGVPAEHIPMSSGTQGVRNWSHKKGYFIMTIDYRVMISK